MSTAPETMRASVLTAQGQIHVEQRPVPTPGPGEVLIRVTAVGVCGSDVHYYEHGRIGPYVVEEPLILGHEAAGEIVGTGSGVDAARIGERVSVEPQRPCRRCEFCREGSYNLCPSIEFYATPPVDGAFCEYVTIDDEFAYAIPDGMSDNAAALLEPLSVAIAAAQKGGIAVGDTVLIAGGGPIGIIAGQVARAFGAADVVVSDISATRRQIAERYGLRTLDPVTDAVEEVSAHVFIDASGATPAIVSGVRATRSGGTVVLVGSADEFPLSVSEVAMRELNVTGIFRYTNTWPIARQLVESGAVELDSLVTHEYGLEQVEEALTAKNTEDALKRVVLPSSSRIETPRVGDRG